MALSPALKKLVSNASNKYSRSSGNRIKPKEGRNRYRFLAPTSADATWIGADEQFWADLGVHWIKTEKGGKPVAVVGSRDVVYQEACPIGAAVTLAIANAFDEDSKELYKEWAVKRSILINVIDRAGAEDEPAILELTPTTFAQVMDIIQQYGENEEDITDLLTGMDIVITKSGKGLQTEYAVNIAPGASKPLKKDIYTRLHDLKAHIEKEFFRGDEQKALNAIGQCAGIQVPRLTANSNTPAAALAAPKTPTPALASPAAIVEDAVVEDSINDDGVDLDALNASVEEAEAETPQIETPAPVTKAAAPKAAAPAPAEDPDTDTLDSILADLAGI